MSARRQGVSYSRFSDPKQAKGDSEDRQAEMFRTFTLRHNLTPIHEIFADRGRSGYRDEHRKKGRLGQLVAMAKDGRFEPGTVIVVEAWDRLGRLRPDKQTELVAELLRTGVNIGVCRLDDIFTEDDFGTHKWTTLAVFIQLAYQESKQKAERVGASWQRRRERARRDGTLPTSRLPAWMECVAGKARLIPERAAAVKRIFQLAAAGYGHTRIISTLLAESVAPFGEAIVREGRTRSQFSGKWSKPYVALILNDGRAAGRFQFSRPDGTPDGAALDGFLPAAVTEEEFLLARAGQDQRRNKDKLGRKSGPRESRYVNVFKGLLKHARDGEGFTLNNKGTTAAPDLILVNTTGGEGRGRCHTFPYPVFEEAILRRLREVNPKDVLPREDEEPSKTDVLRARLANVRSDLAGLQEDLKAGYSKALASVLRDREQEEERLAAELQEELARSVVPAERAWKELPSLVSLIKDSDDPDALRLKLRGVLRRVIDSIWILTVRLGSVRLCVTQVHFTGGGVRDYMIHHKTAGFRRSGGWSVESMPAHAPAGLDLRRPDHAARLEAALQRIPIADIAGAATSSVE